MQAITEQRKDKIEYKGYIIEKEIEPWAIQFGYNYFFYPGDMIDVDWNGKSTVKNAKSIEDAKEEIDELTHE